jgi:uncharacterized protein
MRIEGRALLLRIYVGETDRHVNHPLYVAIAHLLRERGLAGATVLRGVEGFGRTARRRATRPSNLSDDLSIVIEVVDEEARIRAVLPELEGMVSRGLITVEPVEVIAYRSPEEEQRS